MKNGTYLTLCVLLAFSVFTANAREDTTLNRVQVARSYSDHEQSIERYTREQVSFTYTANADITASSANNAVEFTPPDSGEPTDFKSIGNDDDPWGPQGEQGAPQHSVAYEWMGAWIDNELQGRVVGYAYVINGDGTLKHSNADGDARTPADGDVDMSIHTRSYTASVTKQITSVATVKILQAAGLSIDTYIADYLPSGWTKGDGVDNITFRHLLTHSTGWGQLWDTMTDEEQEDWNNGWDGLKYVISLDAAPGSSRSYKNANLALLRILIPRIWVQMGGAPYTEVTKANHDRIYLTYVQNNIFDPIGVYDVTCWMQPAYEEALSYSFDHVDTGGAAFEVEIGQGCGGHSGLRLSAYELAKYLAHLRYGDEIVTLSQLGLINQDKLGWDYASEGKYTKNGYTFHTVDVETGSGNDNHLFLNMGFKLDTTYEYRKSSRACVALLPYGVEASLVINSEYEGGESIATCAILRDAFDFAAN